MNVNETARLRELEKAISRCREYLPLLRPGQFFSHLTAARLYGCPFDGAKDPPSLHVSVLSPARPPRSLGVIGHGISSPRAKVVVRYGLPVSSPATTWLSLGSLLSLDELVVAADHFVLDPYQLDPGDLRPYCTIEELQLALASTRGRGARAATSALQLVRQGAASRTETLLRLLLQRAGLPEPELNQDVFDNADKWLGRVDLLYRESRTIVEYDGIGHRVDRATFENDTTRRERFVNAGFTPVHVLARGLFIEQAATVERVRAALARGGWRK